MLNKIEFTDLYRFLTSIGLIFIASSLLIPWLFMKQELGLISELDYKLLVESSKELVNNRICLNLFVIKALPYISISFFIIGCSLTYIGISKWKKKQGIVDEGENLRLLELRNRVESMNPIEARAKAKKEVVDEIVAYEKSISNSNSSNEIVNTTEDKKEILTEKLINMETLFFKKIEAYNSFNYEVKQNVKMPYDFSIDILLQAFNLKTHSDVIIEIKFLQSSLSMKFIRDSFNKIRRAQVHYSLSTRRNSRMEFIVVYKDKIASKDEISRFISACKAFEKEINYTSYRIHIMSESETANFNIEKIIE